MMAATQVVSRQHQPLHLKHIPTLDLLRGAAILLVLLFHAYGSVDWVPMLGSFAGSLMAALVGEFNFGVQLFFLLSGFLITSILMKGRSRSGYYRDFYVKRVLRILPVFLVILVLLKTFLPISWRFFVASLLFLSNFAPLFGAHSSEYGPLWSLCVEEHFYLLWPTCVRHLKVRMLAPVLAAVILLEPLLRVLAIEHNAAVDIRFKTPFVLDYIAYGALLAVLTQTGKIHRTNARGIALALIAISVPLVGLSLYLAAFHPGVVLVALRPVPWMWMCAGVLLLGIDRDARKTIGDPDAIRSPGLLGFFAYISYGLYLIAPFVGIKLGPFVMRQLSSFGFSDVSIATGELAVCGGVAVLLAYLSRRFFEQPILDLKGRLLSGSR